MITVRPYSEDDRMSWNDFLKDARTQSFLFSRNFMEYHADRFQDHSLMIFDGGRLEAIFPANLKDNVLVSHGGLTFGGLIVHRNTYTRDSIRYLAAMLRYCSEANIGEVILKQSPSFYATLPQDELDYALFVAGARLFRVDIAYAIDQRLPVAVPYQERRRRAIKKGLKNRVTVRESADFQAFWERVLTPNLQERFGVSPVHSLNEIQALATANPGCIRQFEAWQDDTLMAGCTVFDTGHVAHAQYISATDEGRKNGAIDLLFDTLINQHFKSRQYFDFGIVNEEEGRKINAGLLDWKEGFGARAYAHRFYAADSASWTAIEGLFPANTP